LICGHDTEELVQFILNDLEKEKLDDTERKEAENIEVLRESAPTTGLSSEPTTIAATITLATILVPRVARIIERWMVHQQQLKEMQIVADGFSRSDAEGNALAHIAETHAKVAISYPLERSSTTGTKSGTSK
jgi:hypothetical protein